MSNPSTGESKKVKASVTAAAPAFPATAVPPVANINRVIGGQPARHPLGGISEKMVRASTVPKVAFSAVLKDLPGNPFIYQRRVAQSLLPANAKVVVTQNLVNQMTSKPLNTNVADQIKDVATGSSQ